GPGRHVDPPALKARHHLPEALTFNTADQVLLADRVVLEDDLAGVDGLVAELVDLPDHPEGVALLGDELADALIAGLGLGVGLGDHDENVAVLAVGNEGLGAGDAVPVAGLPGHRPD